MVVGIAAQTADHPADGIGFAVQGLPVLFLTGEAFFQIGDGTEVIGLITAVEAIGELGDPATFGLEFSSKFPEAGGAADGGGSGGEGKGDGDGIGAAMGRWRWMEWGERERAGPRGQALLGQELGQLDRNGTASL